MEYAENSLLFFIQNKFKTKQINLKRIFVPSSFALASEFTIYIKTDKSTDI